MPSQTRTFVVLTSIIGSLVEYYDFAIYGFFAAVLAHLFFPHNSPNTQLVLVYTVFAIGYVVRPLGGILFGHLGDVLGRKTGLLLSIVGMSLPLLLMAILPTYQVLGMAAPVILVLCRLLQGLAVGGELPGAITFLTEHANPRYRGLTASLAFLGVNLGLALASGVGALLSHLLNPTQQITWGWRVAFLLGAILALLGYWVRRHLQETPIFLNALAQQQRPRWPLLHSLRHEGKNIITAMGITATFGAAIPVVFVLMPVYLTHYLHLPLSLVLTLNTANTLFFSLMIPCAAWISDQLGRRIALAIGAVGFVLLSYPLFQLLQLCTLDGVMAGLMGLSILTAFVTGPLVPALAECFQSPARATSVALGYNLSVAIFGGTAPVIITSVLGRTHHLDTPAWLLMVLGAISSVFVLFLKSRHRMNL